jgi:hypothetical protein
MMARPIALRAPTGEMAAHVMSISAPISVALALGAGLAIAAQPASLTDAEIDSAIAGGQAATVGYSNWTLCVDPAGNSITLDAGLSTPLSVCFSTPLTRVATLANIRKRTNDLPLTREDPNIGEELRPLLIVSTVARLVGVREFGWQMTGPRVTRIVLLPRSGEPIRSGSFRTEGLSSRTIEDVRVELWRYHAEFATARLPAGDFDVAIVLDQTERRVHVARAQHEWIR